MEGHCSTGQSPQWAVVPMEEEREEEEEHMSGHKSNMRINLISVSLNFLLRLAFYY